MFDQATLALTDFALPKPMAPPKSRQATLGQFFTPEAIADFMAGLFSPLSGPARLLDAGAGEGVLTSAFVRHWHGTHQITADAYERDDAVIPTLSANLAKLSQTPGVSAGIAGHDFLEAAATMVVLGRGARYDRAILNPPYRKIGTGSRERNFIGAAGLETVNLYSGFVGLALKLLAPGGELVAIIPRSFCNGPYYRPFRHLLFRQAALKQIHLFASRRDAFAGDGVLQENVIIHLVGGATQGDVIVSTSTGADFSDLSARAWPIAAIVSDDDQQIISIPDGRSIAALGVSPCDKTLAAIGVDVSTGPIVDFRLRPHLRADYSDGDVPLLYPTHIKADGIRWPAVSSKKPNAIAHNAETERWLFPSGWYVLIKRFSSKEERRRVVATVVDPAQMPGNVIGIENHLNVLHAGRAPLPEMLARGLATYLNSSAVDQAFRAFSGHTQVNASDLRRMGFPDRTSLEAIGQYALDNPPFGQAEIDECVLTGMLFKDRKQCQPMQ